MVCRFGMILYIVTGGYMFKTVGGVRCHSFFGSKLARGKESERE